MLGSERDTVPIDLLTSVFNLRSRAPGKAKRPFADDVARYLRAWASLKVGEFEALGEPVPLFRQHSASSPLPPA